MRQLRAASRADRCPPESKRATENGRSRASAEAQKEKTAGVTAPAPTRLHVFCLSSTPLHDNWADTAGQLVESALISYW